MSPDNARHPFLALKVRVAGESLLNHIFFRPHSLDFGADSDRQSGQAVFVTGLSEQLAQQDVLETLFRHFDQLQSIVVHPSQLSAVILFESSQGLEKLIRASEQSNSIHVPINNVEPQGIKRWMLNHKAKVPGNLELQKQLDQWIETFEEQEKASTAAAAAGGDDGWTVVTRKPGRRKTKEDGGSIAVAGISQALAEAKQKQKPVKVLENFYRHQKWQKQKSDLLSLKAKFAEDKKKVAALKAARRFRPT